MRCIMVGTKYSNSTCCSSMRRSVLSASKRVVTVTRLPLNRAIMAHMNGPLW